ncbi:MAG: hypothetical protein DRP01_05585 [Archaeoglobales archaeon]|nr:MAG: hypothetical protein DRP01_05585 [Archaeoglobales archaeon]
MDIKEVWVMSDGENIYFKIIFYEPWIGDPHDDIDVGILIDSDRDANTGMNDSTSWYPCGVNGIGADYLAIIGVEGDLLWRWNSSNLIWENYAQFTYLDLKNDTNQFVVGISLSDIGNPKTMNIVIVNVDYAGNLYWDYVPDCGEGYLTYSPQKVKVPVLNPLGLTILTISIVSIAILRLKTN